MISNYLKTALRNIIRSKGHSVINVFGLSVAMALCILIFLLVRQELSYDDFHEKGANVFRVSKTAFMGEYRTIGMTPVPLAPALDDAYAGIVRTVRYANTEPVLVSSGDVTVREETVFYADPGFFDLFTFQAVSGFLEGALESRSRVILNEQIAEKYFGDARPRRRMVDYGRPETPGGRRSPGTRQYHLSVRLSDFNEDPDRGWQQQE